MNARKKAWELLCEICLQEQYGNLLLRHSLTNMNRQDKAFITQLVYGTLQHAAYLRYQWESLVKKKPDERLCVLLDMSVYQLLFMDKLPSYAVVSEAVELTKATQKSAAGMVNAVLHKVLGQGPLEPTGTWEEILALKTSHPLWLVRMWKAQYGADVCRSICEYDMQTHPLAVRVNTLKITKKQLMEEYPQFHDGMLARDAIRIQEGNPAELLCYQEGYITIQDEASQLVSEWLDAQPHERILDVCAAPGTKTTHLAQMMNNQGHIIAGDIHEHRVHLIEEGAKRLGIDIIEARIMDAVELNGLKETSFDRVLCDVPCSGYGVLSRKSDIKYRMKPEDMDTLIPLQKRILEKAACMVKEQGILLYSTCTLNKKENERQIAQFLQEHEEFICLKEQTVFPYLYDCDGFYMAKLQKQSEKR